MFDDHDKLFKMILIAFIITSIILVVQCLLEFIIIPLTVTDLVGTDWILFIIIFYINATLVIILAIPSVFILILDDPNKSGEKPKDKRIERIEVKHYERKPPVKKSKAKTSRAPKKTKQSRSAAYYLIAADKYKMARAYDDAIKNYVRALEIEPETVSALTSLGVIYKNQGETKKAIEVSERAVKIDPKSKFAFNLLGLIYMNTEDYDKAIKAYEQALNLDISSKEAAHNLGFAYAKKGDNKTAIEIITAALDKSPKYSQVWYKLAKIYLNDHRTDEALAACNQSIILNPDSKQAKNLLDVIERSSGEGSTSKIDVVLDKIKTSPQTKAKSTDSGEWVIAGSEKYPKKVVEEYERLGKIAVRGNKFTGTFKEWYSQYHNK